jgi:uncharacterized membrane protein SirB2
VDYATIKLVHQSAVALSLAGFFARGAGALSGARWVAGRAAKTLPHIVDTILLVSAIVLAWLLRLSPFDAPWLMAKIVGLLVYIVLGAIALKPGPPLGVRAVAWVAAIATFGYIVSVALSKDPRGFLAGMA